VQRVLFIKGDDRLSFAQIAEVIDLGHAAGVDQIGLMTPKVLAGQ
jgi:biopolymer transport protein ExbD